MLETPVWQVWDCREPVPGPSPRTTLSSLGILSPSGSCCRLPPSATSAAAPPPARAPFARPSHAGRCAAGHPGPGRPRLPRPRLGPASRVLLLLWRRPLGLTRAGPGADGWCGMQAREPARLPGGFRSGGGGATLPRRPAQAPPIGPPPAAYAKVALPSSHRPRLTQVLPHRLLCRCRPAPPRPLAWPCGNLRATLVVCSQVQAQALFPSVTPDLRSPMALL